MIAAPVGEAGAVGAVGAAGEAGTTQRAVPYNCPFCAEEDLRPVPSGAVEGLTRGGWHCRSCLRVFSLSFHGIHRPPLDGPLFGDDQK